MRAPLWPSRINATAVRVGRDVQELLYVGPSSGRVLWWESFGYYYYCRYDHVDNRSCSMMMIKFPKQGPPFNCQCSPSYLGHIEMINIFPAPVLCVLVATQSSPAGNGQPIS